MQTFGDQLNLHPHLHALVTRGETLDALELLARVLAHIPDPKRYLVRYYGAYSNLVRDKQKALIRRVYEVDPLLYL